MLAKLIASRIIAEGLISNSKNADVKEISLFPIGLLTAKDENADQELKEQKLKLI